MPRMLLVVVLLAAKLAAPAQSDVPQAGYDFSLSRAEKIKLAKSAAPPDIADKATVYVLERSGVREGAGGNQRLLLLCRSANAAEHGTDMF
jgi:hypothetical protein